MRLHPRALVANVRLDCRDSVGSTNDEALALARRGESGSVWVTASVQTAGRGRRGRAWSSQPGNLFASLLLTDPGPTERAAELSFVAGLAVRDAIVAFAPDLAQRIKLKWPNDVLVDGAKVAGILVEGEVAENARFVVAIGVGINCCSHPRDTSYPATDLIAVGAPVSAERMLEALSDTMLARLSQWGRGDGFETIRANWIADAAGVGGEIALALGGRFLAGRFAGLDDRGRLLLRLPTGETEAIASGEVFLTAPHRGAA